MAPAPGLRCRGLPAKVSSAEVRAAYSCENVGSTYWNQVHGFTAEDVKKDLEGLQTMRTLARNMTFLMKSIALGKEAFGLPQKEAWQPTHFIR